MAMISSFAPDISSYLNWLLEANMDLDASTKLRIQTLKIKARFLGIIFAGKGKFQIDDMNLKALLNYEFSALNALQELQVWFGWNQNSSKRELRENLDVLISSALEKLKQINPYIQQTYAALSNSTRTKSSKTGAVVQLIEALVRNMKELLSCKAQTIVPVEMEIKALMQDLLFLRNFIVLTKNWRGIATERPKGLLMHAESVADNTACLMYLCSDQDSTNMGDDMANFMKFQLSSQLQRIKSIDPNVRESYIRALKASRSTEVSNFFVDENFVGFLDSLLGNMIELSKVRPMISVIDHVASLHDELKILRYFLVDSSAQPYIQSDLKMNDLFLHIKTVVCDVACIIYSCYDNGINEDMVRQLNQAISFLLQEFKVIKQKARVIYGEMIPKSLRSSFPKTDELGFMDFMIQNLEELLNSKADSIVQFQYHIEEIHGNIFSLREDFITITDQPSEHAELKDLWAHFKDIVYHTEYVIDSITLRDKHLWCHKLGLVDTIEEMKHIRKAVDDMKDRSTNDNISATSSEPDSSLQFVTVAEMPINDVELFEDETKKITEQLTNSLTQLQILSIVGMPGIGKTTLANSIYENPAVHKNFYVRARCCVSQTYEKRRLLLEILQQVCREYDPEEGTNDANDDDDSNAKQYKTLKGQKYLIHSGDGKSDDELAEKLYKSLKGQKYLIFFDDLWDIRPWNDTKTSFPDDDKGSRIIFTSRFQDIASQIDIKNITFPLPQLSDDKSWELLQVKLFRNESCPQELLKVGKKLAKECEGLPLALDLVAGLLKNVKWRKDRWKKLVGTLSTHLLEGQGGIMGVLELSYNNLPSHLKPCFLYFGAFPEDEEVPTRKLMWLWIAEGFIQLKNDEKGSLEDVAEKYLNDLIARSLVTVSQRRSDGGVKASRVHDLLHEFSLAKAKEEFFLQVLSLSSPDQGALKDPYHLSVHAAWNILDSLNPYTIERYTQRARSLLLFHTATLTGPWDLSTILKKFKLLRVLHFPQPMDGYCPRIFSMVHLRILYLPNYIIQGIPSEVSNLQNLETFVLGRTTANFPNTIWSLKRLRHFKVDWPYFLPAYSLENPLKFDHLQTLSTPLLSHGEQCEKIMRGLHNLRRLSCIFLDSWDLSSKCNHFPVLDFLTQLESLKVTHHSGKALLPCQFNFPPNLKKLTLSNFGLPWTEISTFGKLPNLQVLKLLAGAFVGKTWNVSEEEFCELKFLKLQSLNIKQWNTSEDYLPCLETLVFTSCIRLEEIPSCLGNVPTLERLELHDCSDSAGVSAGKIKETQVEMGNEQFVLKLSRSGVNRRIFDSMMASMMQQLQYEDMLIHGQTYFNV